ncbi:putative salicylate hydroxylase [Aspergillus saccharolyticus JOP 1030-1]|uniref:FAD/NAD(P)-binding domain-containing protein n=1 Tax=Aspergillus saccharolyticus JOP 1030-1 TaxID=1450539 RepID=A0A319AE96_9EURO|nr:FAD/NAD(P)-binding domain-containing protein [Aspergillus saccharolyticus JOP 1030-1]PYH49798.1 FAD/NAD(P)-binding domain-containing protein [Aspergillus saccharolyticus JOP 1030-1]
MPLWPRIQFHEIGDQSWCPAWLHQHEQFTLTQLWNLRIPFWSRGSLATQACGVLHEHLSNLSSYSIIDFCAGAGGPTPVLERELNQPLEKAGYAPVQFLLTDLYPHLEAWQRITKKQPNISYVADPVDARLAPRYADKDRKECRVFNICFHHFADEDARGILRSAVQEGDAFVIFEITSRDAWTFLCSPLVFFFNLLVTLQEYWWSPLHLFFTYVVPVTSLSLWLDGLISCLRTRTPAEVSVLLQQDGLEVGGWKFASGQRTVQWPFITLHYYAGRNWAKGSNMVNEMWSGEREMTYAVRLLCSMQLIIIGAGLAGLTTSITLAHQKSDFRILILEKSPSISSFGAGIQIPPNGTRIMQSLNLLPQLFGAGAAKTLQHVDLRRYDDGQLLRRMPFGEAVEREYAAPWLVVHRGDYHRVLYDEAIRLGVEVRFGVVVQGVALLGKEGSEGLEVQVCGGEGVRGDVVLGADGLWSQVRDWVIGGYTPQETGDLAYRAVIPKEELDALHSEDVDELCRRVAVTSYIGPQKHTIFYPVRGGREYNLVLLRPDDLPPGKRREEAGVQEMRESYAGWDPTLEKLLSRVSSVSKWKLTQLPELPTWTKGPIALLGDACHPTLPYQAQGAAMAVEDGAVIGRLLGLLQAHLTKSRSEGRELSTSDSIASILKLYENLRKARTTRNVRAARMNRSVFHLPDGILQMIRDFFLGFMGVTRESDWTGFLSWRMRQTMGLDVIRDCERAFEEWVRQSGETRFSKFRVRFGDESWVR